MKARVKKMEQRGQAQRAEYMDFLTKYYEQQKPTGYSGGNQQFNGYGATPGNPDEFGRAETMKQPQQIDA